MLANRQAWVHGLIPAILIHMSIGSVYSWTVLVHPIVNYIGCSVLEIQFAFSLAIFFLGTSAAFGGSFVENHVKLSARISEGFFLTGLIVTSIAIYFKSVIGIYFGYGILMGIGLGIGYLTPIKTIMMWFPKNKGFATGCAVTGFGLASSIASPLMKWLIQEIALTNVLLVMAFIYLIMMTTAAFLIKKPNTFHCTQSKVLKVRSAIVTKSFTLIWFIIFINISCGLAVISHATDFMDNFAIDKLVWVVLILMGVFNGAGRLVFAWVSDKLKYRVVMYSIIFILSILLVIGALTGWEFFIATMLIVISATYGAGFSCLPLLISDNFGMKNLSELHGISLTAWAVAGLTGNQIASILASIDPSYNLIYIVLISAYAIGLLLTIKLLTLKNKYIE